MTAKKQNNDWMWWALGAFGAYYYYEYYYLPSQTVAAVDPNQDLLNAASAGDIPYTGTLYSDENYVPPPPGTGTITPVGTSQATSTGIQPLSVATWEALQPYQQQSYIANFQAYVAANGTLPFSISGQPWLNDAVLAGQQQYTANAAAAKAASDAAAKAASDAAAKAAAAKAAQDAANAAAAKAASDAAAKAAAAKAAQDAANAAAAKAASDAAAKAAAASTSVSGTALDAAYRQGLQYGLQYPVIASLVSSSPVVNSSTVTPTPVIKTTSTVSTPKPVVVTAPAKPAPTPIPLPIPKAPAIATQSASTITGNRSVPRNLQ